MGTDTTIYKLLLLIHVASVVVGFGPLLLSALFTGRGARRGGASGAAVLDATADVTRRWSEPFVYLVFVTGLALVIVSDEVWEFSQSWVSIGFTTYLLALGVLHGLLRPSVRRLREVLAGGPAVAGATDEVASLQQRITLATGALDVLVVIALAAMLWKPGV